VIAIVTFACLINADVACFTLISVLLEGRRPRIQTPSMTVIEAPDDASHAGRSPTRLQSVFRFKAIDKRRSDVADDRRQHRAAR